MTDRAEPDLAALLDEMREHPDRVVIERIAWSAVVGLVDELGDDATLGSRVRHAIRVYQEIREQPPAAFGSLDASRFRQ